MHANCIFRVLLNTQALAAAERPLILYGSAVLERDDAASIISILKSLNSNTKVSKMLASCGMMFVSRWIRILLIRSCLS